MVEYLGTYGTVGTYASNKARYRGVYMTGPVMGPFQIQIIIVELPSPRC